jgi:hypothetical protein
VELLVNEKLGTTNADAIQNIHDVREELDEIYGAGQAEMTEMAGTPVIRLPTAPAGLTIIEDAHARIKESANTRLRPIICARISDFHYRALLDFLWTEDAKLNAHDGLNIRIGAMKSCWHLSSVIVGGF